MRGGKEKSYEKRKAIVFVLLMSEFREVSYDDE